MSKLASNLIAHRSCPLETFGIARMELSRETLYPRPSHGYMCLAEEHSKGPRNRHTLFSEGKILLSGEPLCTDLLIRFPRFPSGLGSAALSRVLQATEVFLDMCFRSTKGPTCKCDLRKVEDEGTVHRIHDTFLTRSLSSCTASGF